MSHPSIARIARLVLITADIDTLARFFIDAFDAKPGRLTRLDRSHSVLLGLPDAEIEELSLSIGRQDVVLQRIEPQGRPYPSGSTSTDLWFQHFAIVVSDMAAAYDRLRATGMMTPISEGGPQTLPPSSGSVEAFKFRDFEGHPLELLCFPKGEGPATWQADREGGLVLGIDHSAISVGDAQASRHFFEGALGLSFGERSRNVGIEQSRMDAVANAEVSVIGLNPEAAPPHVELLGYEIGLRRPIDPATTSADIAATRYEMETPNLDAVVETLTEQGVRFVSPGIVPMGDGGRAALVLDPDGHRIVVRDGPAAAS